MPRFTVQLPAPQMKDHLLTPKSQLINLLMTRDIPKAIQLAFANVLDHEFGLEKITKRLDLSVVHFSNKLFVLVECHDRAKMDTNQQHDVEEAIARHIRDRIIIHEIKNFPGREEIMPCIHVELRQVEYSFSVLNPEGELMQQVPKRMEE